LTSNNRSIIGKLKPVDWIKELEGETELAVLFSFDMLNICVETRINNLNSRGLRQSPCKTPRPTGMKWVRNSEVITEVLKSVYKLFIKLFM
jgi:hypothetical protein